MLAWLTAMIMPAFTHRFGHANTSITYSQGLVLLVRDDIDPQIFTSIEDAWIGKSGVANFIQGIRTIRDEFPEKNLFITIDGVDDQA